MLVQHQEHSSDPPFLQQGKEILNTSPRGVGICEIKKRGWKYCPGAGLLKRGGELALFLFNFCKIYHFHI